MRKRMENGRIKEKRKRSKIYLRKKEFYQVSEWNLSADGIRSDT